VYYAYNQEQLALRTVGEGATETTYTYSRLTDLRLSAQDPSQSPTTFVWDGSDYLSSYQQGGTTVQYLTIDGEIISEIRGGVVSDYVPDPLGSIRKILNSSGAVTDSYDYWPYGELRQHTGSSQTPLQFVGSRGYYTDPGTNRVYVRARVLRPDRTGWMQLDRYWPRLKAYSYGASNPTSLRDASGKTPWQCERCAYLLSAMYVSSKTHQCNHHFIHCFVCCVLSHEFGTDCALSMQERQNKGEHDPSKVRSRTYGCGRGVARSENIVHYAYQTDEDGSLQRYRTHVPAIGACPTEVPTSACEAHCAKIFPDPDSNDAGCPGHKPEVPFGGHLPLVCYGAWHPGERGFRKWWSGNEDY
jgi:RHS repeat-associated protein